MQLSNERSKFEVEILGYEFPNSKDKDDASWLLVRMTACIDDLSWSAVEPCLRAFELVELRDWFESFATDRPTVGTISFTEHELGFCLSNGDEIRVNLDFRFHPNGKNYNYDADEEYVLSFKLDEVNINDILTSLSKSIERFPERVC